MVVPFQINYNSYRQLCLSLPNISRPILGRRQKGSTIRQLSFDIPEAYLSLLAKEISSVLGDIVIGNDFWVQHFFEGIFFKFTAGTSYRSGDALYDGGEQGARRRDFSIISQSDCYVLSISLMQFEFLLKSIERAKTNKILQLLTNAFNEGVRTGDLKIILKDLVRHSTKRKICTQQVLYDMDTPSNYIYVVVMGEFAITKEFEYNRDYVPIEQSFKEPQQSQYEKFKQLLVYTNTKESLVKSQKIKFETVDYKKYKEVGKENYSLLQKLAKHEANRKLNASIRDKKKFSFDYTLAKIGQGQLIAEEDFTHDFLTQNNHHFKCTCISSSGKVIQIRKQNIYKLCGSFDWFAQMFHNRCERKFNWIQSNYEGHVGQYLNTALQQFLQSYGQEEKKSKDELILQKFAEITKKFKVSDIKDIQATEQQQDDSFTRQMDSGNSPSSYLIEKQRGSQEKIKGLSPVKEYQRQSSSLDLSGGRHENTIKHKAAERFKVSMNKTLNPQLKNPIKVYKSDLLKENCIIYEQQNEKEQKKSVQQDRDIGLLSYLVQIDKKQLRLLNYTITKNIRSRPRDMSTSPIAPQLPNLLPSSIEMEQYPPNQFNNFQNLLHHVTKQHISRLIQNQLEHSSQEQLPMNIRRVIGPRESSEPHVKTRSNTTLSFSRSKVLDPRLKSLSIQYSGMRSQSTTKNVSRHQESSITARKKDRSGNKLIRIL